MSTVKAHLSFQKKKKKEEEASMQQVAPLHPSVTTSPRLLPFTHKNKPKAKQRLLSHRYIFSFIIMYFPAITTAMSSTTTPINPLTAMPNKKSKQRAVRVSFNEVVWVQPLHTSSEEDAQHAWYQASELFAFRREGRIVALSLRKGVTAMSPDEYRGFENTAPTRQRQRQLSIRCTLSAHRKGLSSDAMATVAQKCNEWSNEVAFVQACRDYADVYQPHMTGMIPDVASLPGPQFPSICVRKNDGDDSNNSNDSNKRRVSLQGGESDRRVRARAC
jgi:hypothetical protein